MDPEDTAGDCGLIDVGCNVTQAAEDALSGLANDATEAAAEAAAASASLWIDVPTPILASIAEDESMTTDTTVSFIQGSLHWYMIALAVLSVMVAAGRMMWERRAEPGTDLIKSLALLVAVNGAGLVGLATWPWRWTRWPAGSLSSPRPTSPRTW